MPEENDASSNPINDEHLPVAGEAPTRDDDVPLDTSEDSEVLYQDDLDTDENIADPIIVEETEDITEELQVPPEEFKQELDKYDDSNVGDEADDRREAVEDLDEGDNDVASNI